MRLTKSRLHPEYFFPASCQTSIIILARDCLSKAEQ
jgi:hypothetical protein